MKTVRYLVLNNFPALYVVFEGIDGAGKSSRINTLIQSLEKDEISYRRLFEPTNGPFGQEIRRRAKSGPAMTAKEELELFIKDRHEHIAGDLQSALTSKDIVIQDRGYLSSAAYQGSRPGSDLSPGEIVNLHDFAPKADLVIYLDLDVSDALTRIGQRGESDAFESKSRLERVRNNYLSLMQTNWLSLDANQSPNMLDDAIFKAVLQAFHNKRT